VLVAHGPAPYEHNPENRESYYAVLERGGERQTLWGVDLERALAESGSQPGDMIALEVTGTEMVRLPDGTPAERHNWRVRDADELAWERLVSQLSRSGAKETTLDYEPGAAPGTEREQGQAVDSPSESARFAARHGIDMPCAIIVPEQMRASSDRGQAAEVNAAVPAQTRPVDLAPGQPVKLSGPEQGNLVERAREGVESSRAAPKVVSPPAQPEAGRGLDEAEMAAGRAAFRARYAAWQQEKARQAEIAAEARGLVEQWRKLVGGYVQALAGESEDGLANARAWLHGFAVALRAQPEAVRQLCTRPEEFGVADERILTQVLAAREPDQELMWLTTAAEAAWKKQQIAAEERCRQEEAKREAERQEQLRQQQPAREAAPYRAKPEAAPNPEEDGWSDEPGLGM
jgi:hypothetical protein